MYIALSEFLSDDNNIDHNDHTPMPILFPAPHSDWFSLCSVSVPGGACLKEMETLVSVCQQVNVNMLMRSCSGL